MDTNASNWNASVSEQQGYEEWYHASVKLVPALQLRQKKYLPSVRCLGLATVFILAPFFAPRARAQEKFPPAVADFRQIAAQLSTARLDGTADSQLQLDKALGLLDTIALPLLPNLPNFDVEAVNQRLTALVAPTPSVGENYHFVRLGGSVAAYALVVNFGLGGPAAIRIYSSGGGQFALSAKIDVFSQKDFFDSDIELIAVSTTEPVFITISGRTDDLSTGVFSAWRWNGKEAAVLWSSDLLQQSSYLADASGFHLTYCAEPDDNHPNQCPRMSNDLYQWQAGEWKRLESKSSGPSPPTK